MASHSQERDGIIADEPQLIGAVADEAPGSCIEDPLEDLGYALSPHSPLEEFYAGAEFYDDVTGNPLDTEGG